MSAPIIIHTDGACSGNPGPGGWAAILQYGAHEKILQGSDRKTTNNRMEMQAVIAALQTLKRPVVVELYTDSRYVMYGAEKWLPVWQKKNWRTANKKPVKNQDLWEILAGLLDQYTVHFHWVRGHDGNVMNERCDQLARASISQH
ncbi:MAG: ribonuclease HI [Pseudomonadota bacterium]